MGAGRIIAPCQASQPATQSRPTSTAHSLAITGWFDAGRRHMDIRGPVPRIALVHGLFDLGEVSDDIGSPLLVFTRAIFGPEPEALSGR